MKPEEPHYPERRGLGPILGRDDFHRAVHEMGLLLLKEQMSPEERTYFDGLRAIVDEFESYSMGKDRALPQKMLAYLTEVAQPMSLEAVESATGLTDLQTFMNRHRQLTLEERNKLASFFGVAPEVFAFAPEHFDYDEGYE